MAALTVAAHLPGRHDQSTHGRGGRGGLTGQAALDAAPAQFTAAPGGHGGSHKGEKLEAPDGAGPARAIGEYEGVEYQTTNTTLRGGFRKPEPGDRYAQERERAVAARVTEIDKTMGVSRLKSDVQVERVIGKGAEVFGRDAWYGSVVDWKTNDFDEVDRQVEQHWNKGERPSLKGMSWREKGYVSTTADPRVTAMYGQRFKVINSDLDGEPVVMRMFVPKGTGAVRLSPMTPQRVKLRSEAELLLQRDLTATVVEDHGVGPDGLRHLDVEVRPA